jgi:hypothetical protein
MQRLFRLTILQELAGVIYIHNPYIQRQQKNEVQNKAGSKRTRT